MLFSVKVIQSPIHIFVEEGVKEAVITPGVQLVIVIVIVATLLPTHGAVGATV